MLAMEMPDAVDSELRGGSACRMGQLDMGHAHGACGLAGPPRVASCDCGRSLRETQTVTRESRVAPLRLRLYGFKAV